MDFFKTIIIKFMKEIIIGIEAIGIVVLAILLQQKKVCINEGVQETVNAITEEVGTADAPLKIKVDIKGAVMKPGVYEVFNTNNVNDVIELAGGLKKTADTSNLNLSRKVTDQMVIKVFTDTEIKKRNAAKTEEITSCISNTIVTDSCKDSSIIEVNESKNDTAANTATQETEKTQSNNMLIPLNTATLEQLTTLAGIGESKARSIIEYRENVGKFTKIEDIMNVSGIGESLFNKIKDYITI